MLVGITAAALLFAAPARGEVPAQLEPWEGWVLHGEERALCPQLVGGDNRLCAWPGRLELKLDNKGGTLSQGFHVYGKEQWLPLPGDLKHWPQSVKVDGKDAVVAPRKGDGAAAVLLTAGPHTVTGTFDWAELPEALFVPPDTGLLDLTVRGKVIAFPDARGRRPRLPAEGVHRRAGREPRDPRVPARQRRGAAHRHHAHRAQRQRQGP